MKQQKSIYISIDLKSFYASVECLERKLDPLTTNLVVADASRTEKTICLAVSPSLKQYGISGRARLFEVIQKVKEVNVERQHVIKKRKFQGESYDDIELKHNPYLELTYIVAPPRMAFYMEYSTRIYEIYLKYIAPEDIHVYSIDEVFIDVTHYLKTYQMTPRELAKVMILDIYKETGITATAGIGTNLYLCKVAMDIVAKHIKPDQDGVRIAQLNEMRYRKYLWNHTPITDFWRIGQGYAKRLEQIGLFTMGDIAKCSVGKPTDYYNEELLYRMFGVNAELLIDHAWGYEPCTMEDVKRYRPENTSVGTGQVLSCPYSFDKARLVLKEMIDGLSLRLVDKGLVTDQIVIMVGYDVENVLKSHYKGTVVIDRYGRKIPKHARGTVSLGRQTSSSKLMTQAVLKWFDEHVDQSLSIKRMNMSANRVVDESVLKDKEVVHQLDLFTDYETFEEQEEKQKIDLEKEKNLQRATLALKKKYGKNAVLKGMNFEEGSTAKERNETIGGHKA